MKVAIAPWGDPSGWREATYEFEDAGGERGAGQGGGERSITSLKVLQERTGFDKALILVQDSVLFTQLKGDRNLMNNVSRKCGGEKEVEAYLDLAERGIGQGVAIWLTREVKKYKELVERTKKYVECIAESVGIRGAEAIVLPSNFTIALRNVDESSGLPYLRFKSRAKSYFIYTVGMIGLLERTFDYMDSIDRIIVDTTHGLNYFSSLSMTLARDLSFLVQAVRGTQINLEFYSSVPVYEQVYRLTKVSTEVGPKLRGLDPNSFSIDELKSVYNSLVYNSPLALVRSVGDYKSQDITLDLIYNEVNLSSENKELRVDYNLREQPISREGDAYMYSVVKVVRKKCGNNCGDWVPYDFIVELNKSVYSFVSEASEVLIGHESDVLYQSVKAALKDGKMKVGDERLYAEIYNAGCYKEELQENKGGGKDQAEILRRHMIAHGGLLKDYVKVKVIEGGEKPKVLLAYRDWERLKSEVL